MIQIVERDRPGGQGADASPHTVRVRRALGGAGALVIYIRIDAGPSPADHWIHDARSGAGRLLGEMVIATTGAPPPIPLADILFERAGTIAALEARRSARRSSCRRERRGS